MKNGPRAKIIDFFEARYREDKSAIAFTSNEIFEGVALKKGSGINDIIQVRNAINGMVRAGTVIKTEADVIGRGGKAIKKTTWSLMSIVERETNPTVAKSTPKPKPEPIPVATFVAPKEKDNNEMAVGKPRQGTVEYDLAKANERADRLEAMLEKSLTAYGEARDELRALAKSISERPKIDPDKSVKGILAAIEEVTDATIGEMSKKVLTHNEKTADMLEGLLKGIGAAINEILNNNDHVEGQIVKMLKAISSADKNEQRGFEKGFGIGWNMALSTLAKEGEAEIGIAIPTQPAAPDKLKGSFVVDTIMRVVDQQRGLSI